MSKLAGVARMESHINTKLHILISWTGVCIRNCLMSGAHTWQLSQPWFCGGKDSYPFVLTRNLYPRVSY